MKKTTLNGIALIEVVGLINQLFTNLTGPKSATWLFAFKRFLRMENPWLANPFEQTVEQQLATLREVNLFWQESGHPFIEDIDATCARLAEAAPEWPEGKDAYRIIRIRFGEGRDGVIKTFEAHAAAVKHVHNKFRRGNLLLTGEHPYKGKNVDRLRLLVGNETHKPVVEWVTTTNLSAHRERDSVEAVRGPESLADEGLALAWQVPDRVRAIDYKEWCAWFCAGYELNVPEGDGGPWRRVVLVHRGLLYGGATHLHACWHSDARSAYSVPPVG